MDCRQRLNLAPTTRRVIKAQPTERLECIGSAEGRQHGEACSADRLAASVILANQSVLGKCRLLRYYPARFDQPSGSAGARSRLRWRVVTASAVM